MLRAEATTKLTALGATVDQKWVDDRLRTAIEKVRAQIPRFDGQFPSACTTAMRYRIKANDDWTNGFWTAMMWMSYEVTGEKIFKTQAEAQLASFQRRLDDHFVLDHHDIGFLYSLSAVAGYRVTGDYQRMVLQAADVLLNRYQPKGQFIQAWGVKGAADEYRLIIDSLLNLPLLFEATKLSGDAKYAEVGQKHYHQVLSHIVRPDYSTYHTFYYDPQTGAPLKGATAQGYSDDSCWARGQAWILLGMPLYKRFFEETDERALYQHLVGYYLDRTPADLIPYWDLIFDDQSDQPKDSSAAAIVACGALEAQQRGYWDDGQAVARGLLKALDPYRTEPGQEGLLQHGVYAYSIGKGVDEANLWGDYFYMEALMRLARPSWQTYW
ncbi:glycoside hydrolase family 88 protein [Lactiplantibacillus modestisalitolerans]|uniref:Glycoside hydrolase family 88 protein n=1 Tax=Lactiplantibacillus modestisalitolerans TaxID=1457219 RepID=A0ABV5WU66_9LACO|nr:glycoside hydrolase family 88 protein [Lactiplantibacillus modestisalitolerans]